MWFDIKDENMLFEYLKSGIRWKVNKVFNYLIDGNFNNNMEFYRILKNHGYLFDKHQHLSLITNLIEYPNCDLFRCLQYLNLNHNERMLVFIKILNLDDSNYCLNNQLEELIDSSFVFNDDELGLIINCFLKSSNYEGMKLIYDNICLPKFLSNLIEPILVMNKLME